MGNERVFIDTNLFLRYLTNDVPEQADVVEELLRKAAAGELILITNNLLVAELVWTLDSFYKLEREDIQDKVAAIMNTPGLEVMDSELLIQALRGYVEKNVDFIDAYNVAWMLLHGVKDVYTFDRKHFNRFEQIVVHVPQPSPSSTPPNHE